MSLNNTHYYIEAIPPFKGGAEELRAGRGMYYSKHQSL